jgi:hypothetical protein
MRLNLNEAIVPKELRDNGQLLLKNLDGEVFSTKIYEKPKKFYVERDRLELTDVSVLSSMLLNFCSVLTADYWHIEWCHRAEIRQFHLEVEDGQVRRSPDYSLGVYQRTVAVRERGEYWNETARIVKLVDFFDMGQYCDETGKYRNTEVHLQCCDGLHINNINPEKEGEEELKASFKAMSEPSICAYQLVVCSPLLCTEREPDLGLVESTGKGNNQTLSEVMRLLYYQCMTKTEEWWSYELCFSSSIR